MTVLQPRSSPSTDELRGRLDELLARSDIVTLHLPLTEQSRHLIDPDASR